MSTAVLLPSVQTWDTPKFVLHNLRYGPHCIDPNQAMPHGEGRKYVNGWYDDGRDIPEAEFDAAMVQIKVLDENRGETESCRDAQAQALWRMHKCQVFLREVESFLADDTILDDFVDDLTCILVHEHLHYWHRFRLVPEEKVRRWNVPSLQPEGLALLATLPARLRDRS